MTDSSRVIELTQQLVSINSENPPGREKEVASFLLDYMEENGITGISVGSKERPNLIFSTMDDKIGTFVFHGHMDTVPIGDLESWEYDPFEGKIVNDRLYGRGACDMKGPVAAILEALLLFKEKERDTPFVVLCTSDEESGCSGAEAVADDGILQGVKYGVCAEPTSLDVLVGEKGILWSRVIAQGKSAHGSRPEEGLNAITLCQKALTSLLQHEYHYETNELLGKMTINVGTIQGGIKVNVVPDHCESQIDMRTVKGQTIEGLLDEMENVLRQAGLSENVSVEYIHGKPAVITPATSKIVEITQDTVERITGKRNPLTSATYGTDCSVLQPRVGIQNVICGPGSIEQAHQPNEYIDVKQLEQAVQVYLGIAQKLSAL